MRELTISECELVSGGHLASCGSACTITDLGTVTVTGDGGNWPYPPGDNDNGEGGGTYTPPTEDNECSQEATADGRVNREFIADLEGAARQDGYVPRDNNGNPADNSGVTIGTGVDLGQWSAAELLGLGIDQGTVDTLSPYIGLQGWDAVNYENAHPLVISAGQVSLIESQVHNFLYTQVAERYNASSSLDFWHLPMEAQTVIGSVALQYGNLASRTPVFWGHVTAGNWLAAYNDLKDFGDNYDTRREKEAALLKQALDDDTLPDRLCGT